MGTFVGRVAALTPQRLGDREAELLAEIVEKRSRELIPSLPRFPEGLSSSEREAFEGCLADELVLTGLLPSGEPNDRGLAIEALIDALVRPHS
jgi:hypothetical protein